MRAFKTAVLSCLGAVGLVLVVALAVVNWESVSENLVETVDTQTDKAQATLFRLGEVMSISAGLKNRYGVEPDVTYETATGDRILSISFRGYTLPAEMTAERHAREVAVFAIGSTAKFTQIDKVRVLFDAPDVHGFTLDELLPDPP